MRQETRKIERTPEEKARLAAVRERFKSRPSVRELAASGEFGPPIPGPTFWAVMALVKELRAAREAAGLSLADLAKRTGMDKAFLSRLETGKQGNPTMDTVARYAHALGKRIEFAIRDAEPQPEESPAATSSVGAANGGAGRKQRPRKRAGGTR
ncbi:MAG TPA: helix-turn-helix transcriptional regulator [Gemmataceae bacterium]|nr:helix-turn-helix transcriptional regulator [Gemmataceae bacterium]